MIGQRPMFYLKHKKSVFYCFSPHYLYIISPVARVFDISIVFSSARRVFLSQCNTRLRLLYLLNKLFKGKLKASYLPAYCCLPSSFNVASFLN